MRADNPQFYFRIYAESGEGRLINSDIQPSSMQIIEVLSGEVELQIGTEILIASQGDFAYVPPTMVYRADAIGGYAAVRGISFEASILRENMENFDAEVFYMFDGQSKNRIYLFTKVNPLYPTLHNYMH